MRAKKRSRARAFVVTLAVAASGCGDGESTTSGGGSGTTGQEPSLLGVSQMVVRRGDLCELHTAMVGCPPDVMCNPPPPRRVSCPSGLTQDGSISRMSDGSCVLVINPVCTPDPIPTCNPPPPQQVPCDAQAVASGLQQRQGDGRCYVFVAPDCPRPTETCTPSETRPTACPDPE